MQLQEIGVPKLKILNQDLACHDFVAWTTSHQQKGNKPLSFGVIKSIEDASTVSVQHLTQLGKSKKIFKLGTDTSVIYQAQIVASGLYIKLDTEGTWKMLTPLCWLKQLQANMQSFHNQESNASWSVSSSMFSTMYVPTQLAAQTTYTQKRLPLATLSTNELITLYKPAFS